MRVIIILGIIMLAITGSYAQRESIWAFGLNAGADFTGGSPSGIKTGAEAGEGCASITDRAGQLLFYTDGSRVWSKDGNLMPDGRKLTGVAGHNGSEVTTASTTQGALIVPVPDSGNKYYIFSLIELENQGNSGKLFYSVVNMDLNNGHGDVEAGRKAILLDSNLTEKMVAVQGDRCNLWLLVCSRVAPVCKAYEITSTGINRDPVSSNIETVSQAGVMKVSPNRRRILFCNVFISVKLFDFDPATGILSNPMILSRDNAYGGCFSEDNSKLYTSIIVEGVLYQYDLSLPDLSAIVNSKTRLGTCASTTDMKLAPNGKIYFTASSGVALGAINTPNIAGTGCGYVSDALYFPPDVYPRAGLPNGIAELIRDTLEGTRAEIKLCFHDSFILTAPPDGWDYSWETGATGPNLTVYSSGDYVAHYYTPPCVYHSDTFSVDFSSRPPQTGSFTSCKGVDSNYLWIMPFEGNKVTYTYTWRDSLGNVLRTNTIAGNDTFFADPGLYSVTMKGDNDCDTLIALRLPTPDSHISFIADSIICMGDVMQFTNMSRNYLNYLWDFGDGDTSILFSPSHIYSRPGTFTVILIGSPCDDTLEKSITVDSLPYIYFTADSLLCEGQTVNFYPEYSDHLTALVWNYGDNSFNDTSRYPYHAYDSSGSWQVIAQGYFRRCASTSYSDTVTISPYPDINIGNDTFLCVGNQMLTLFNHEGLCADCSYLWNTGQTITSIGILHYGLYSLVMTPPSGCAVFDSITINKSCYLDITNAFTPDGDGINDWFMPRALSSGQLTQFRMQVFTRWGQLIFETNALNGKGWDGKFNSIDQPASVYIYTIEVELNNKVREKYQGNITLLR